MKAILVNIFGGIVNCATIAKGIIEAGNRIKFTIPLVVRLEGELDGIVGSYVVFSWYD